MLKFSMSGGGELSRQLRDLQRKSEALSEPQDVSLQELLTDAFMGEYTDFSSLDAMEQAFGGITSKEDLASERWSTFVAQQTRFSDWDEMLNAAGAAWMQRRLGL